MPQQLDVLAQLAVLAANFAVTQLLTLERRGN